MTENRHLGTRWKKLTKGPIFLRMSVALQLRKIDPRRLNARQKENYYFQKISGLLADYGFTTIRLSDDWKGADFLAQYMDGKTLLRVQQKSRLGIYKKYQEKNLLLCFLDGPDCYLYSHDEALIHLLRTTKSSEAPRGANSTDTAGDNLHDASQSTSNNLW